MCRKRPKCIARQSYKTPASQETYIARDTKTQSTPPRDLNRIARHTKIGPFVCIVCMSCDANFCMSCMYVLLTCAFMYCLNVLFVSIVTT